MDYSVPDPTRQPDADEAASLDAQLDSLLARIEQEEPGAVPEQVAPRRAEASQVSLDEMIDRQVDDAIAAAESVMDAAGPADAASSASVSPSADDLTDQVQAMLDDAAARQVMPAGESLHDEAEQIEEIDGELSGSFKAPEAVTGDKAASAVAPPEAAARSEDAQDEADLTELDRLLADEADDAIAGDFESPQDVSSALPDAPQAVHDEAADEALEGTFAAPEDVQIGVDGGAMAVAREIDEQPEQSPAATAAAAKVREQRHRGPRRGAGLLRVALDLAIASLPRVERAARYACAAVNSPLNRLDREWRNTIGYAGLLTTLTAVALILAAVLF